ncbi:hypothetical protein E4T56_gene2929 [Termitomyces sp. T112]|nr:hypothetical protein E4T56_gene2929 [Termitomyces sp. T112]
MLYQYRCYLGDLENESFEYDSFSEDDKQRVDLAVGSLTQLQPLRAVPLLPTGTPSEPMDNGPVTYTHLLPHYVNDDLLSRLEYSWKMPWGTLNVNTSSNIMCLSADMRALFDKGHWLLTPEKRILDMYLQDPCATIDESFYHYTLIAADPAPETPNPMGDIHIRLLSNVSWTRIFDPRNTSREFDTRLEFDHDFRRRYLEETSTSSEISHDDDKNHDCATPPNDITVALDVNEIPSTRALRIARTEAVKECVDIATEDLAQRRCIVHNTEHIYAVEYAHVLPRASNDSLVRPTITSSQQ